MHNVLEHNQSKDGYLLLCILRSYLILDLYASMDVHTAETIAPKGVPKCYTTKYNESMHGSLKDSYLLRSDFKNVAEQV